MNTFASFRRLAVASLLTLSAAAVADTPPALDDTLAGKRVAIVITAGDDAPTVEATRDYFMDRGARVHLLTTPETPTQTLAICNGSIDFVQMVDENQQPMRMGVVRRTNQVLAAAYDVVYVTSGAQPTALGFIDSARGAARLVFLGSTMARWAQEAPRVFSN